MRLLAPANRVGRVRSGSRERSYRRSCRPGAAPSSRDFVARVHAAKATPRPPRVRRLRSSRGETRTLPCDRTGSRSGLALRPSKAMMVVAVSPSPERPGQQRCAARRSRVVVRVPRPGRPPQSTKPTQQPQWRKTFRIAVASSMQRCLEVPPSGRLRPALRVRSPPGPS
jgi:hypothetical protein